MSIRIREFDPYPNASSPVSEKCYAIFSAAFEGDVAK